MMNDKRILNIKHVADLLNMHFRIPCYQRGYRWEQKHVEDLLDDLYNFSIQMDGAENKLGKFYCIQPLAVVKSKALSNDNTIVYDVIDGQQRLTTLYLLLSYLQNARDSGKLAKAIFTLEYESRDSDFFNNQEFKKRDISAAMRNIDFFYMTRAYIAIDDWFNKKAIRKNMILKVLIPDSYKCVWDLDGHDLQTAKEQNDKLNDVRFIWYDVPTENNTDSIEVFSQLNYGKTALTSTELVKALLFQCDIYTNDTPLMREIAFRRSCEWDAMEKQLQNPYMWSMFMREEDALSSHITIVLSLVCEELYNGLKLKGKLQNLNFKLNKETDDFIYQVCNLYLGTNRDGDYAANVKEVWTKIQTTFTALYNWFKSPDLYHLIGLLVWLKEYKNRDFGKSKRYALIKSLMEIYDSVSKDKFVEYLRREIAKIIHVQEKIKRHGGEIPWGLEYINYNGNPIELIRILVTFNVDDVRKQQAEASRFPFHLLRKYKVTSLEHIHPQHLNLNDIKINTIKEWLESKKKDLATLGKLEAYLQIVQELEEYIKDEASYNDNKEKAQSIINQIDKEFDDLANMSESQMHTLYNMALVDRDLNSALSNNLLDKKREILREYHESKKTYVLPATQKAFSKYYSPVDESNMLPKLWTKKDRDAYFAAIKKVYNEYNSYYK